MHFTFLDYLHVQSLARLKCLDGNILATLGLKEVHDAGRALADLPYVQIVLIVKRDTFRLNAEVFLLRLRLARYLMKDYCILLEKLNQFACWNDLIHFKAGQH